jgi:hypothetical protein
VSRLPAAVFLLMLSGLLFGQEPAPVQAPWTLLDQFDQPYTRNDQLRILLVARSMDAAKLLDQALQGKPADYLEVREAVFVADVSRMPALISTLFAIPAMRDYNYRVLLDREPRVVTRYSGDADKLLWVEMKQGKVVSEREFADPLALEKALQQAGQ